MTDHPNIALVRDYLSAAASGDIARATSFFAPDFVYVVQGNNPFAGVTTGPAAALEYFGALMGVSRGSYRIGSEVDWLVSDRRTLLIAEESITIGEMAHDWTRFILFLIEDGRFKEVRLFEDDQAAFDAVWRNVAPSAAENGVQ